MPSFDIVSEPDWSEIKNALNQAEKELAQRYDFKGTNAELELTGKIIWVRATGDDRVRAAYDLLLGKLARRDVSLKHFEAGRMEDGSHGQKKMKVSVQEGLASDKAKQIVKIIKDSGLKVQASIVEDTVRVTGKKRDDLQQVIALLKGRGDLDVALQFQNFRD